MIKIFDLFPLNPLSVDVFKILFDMQKCLDLN